MSAAPQYEGTKRERLIAAARDVIYRQGYGPTTLAQVAEAGGVPLGNVYYYFKTKDALVEAVIEARLDQVRAQLAAAEQAATPARRIAALLGSFAGSAETIARHGCPFSTLVQELEKRGDQLAVRAAEIFYLQRAWLARRFAELVPAEQADGRALELLAAMHGTTVLTFAFHDPELMRRRFQHLIEPILRLEGAAA